MYGGSQFRRPWSPEPFEPSNIRGQYIEGEDEPYPDYLHTHPDGSVEALDLADYARTLEGPYPPFPDYPPSPPSQRPLANPHFQPTPSLTSRDTLSSNHHLSRNRPFSLPPPHRPNPGSHYEPPYDPELDISHFPPWSRDWYTPEITGTMRSSYLGPPPTSHPDSINKKSPFDPVYIPHPSESFAANSHAYFPASSIGHESTRELFPWTDDPPNLDRPLHPAIKEERLRMLEREFGYKGKNRSNHDGGGDFVDANGKPLIGTVDRNGNLVTAGPNKRMATRALQIFLALAASVPSIYAATVMKLKDPPPPANKPPAFVLYLLSVITLLLLLYLFVFRPCCCAGKRRAAPHDPASHGMMVLPIQGLPGGKVAGKNKTQKGGTGTNASNGIQVNLIVDPDALNEREEEEYDENENRGWDGSFQSTRQKRRPRRRSIFTGLAMEEDWKRARGWAKKVAVFDVLSMVLWGAAFVYILIGKRCPSGGFGGWCNAYNVSSAAACLLCLAFGFSVFFDVQDLHSSKTSPRTRP